MNFPGLCKLTLTEEALCLAIEGALNAARRDGEDYVRVTEVGRTGYDYGDWFATITTDVQTGEVVSISTQEVA